MLQRQTVSCFIIFIAMLPFLAFAGTAQSFSEMENRVLQQWPKLSVEALSSGRFMAEMTDYVQDQFWQRSWWVRLKNESERLLGRKDIGNAYLGLRGIYVEKRAAIEEQRLQKNLQMLREFCSWSVAQGADNRFLGVPSSYTVYPERLPAYVPVGDEAKLADTLRQAQGDYLFIDPLPELKKSAEQKLYFHTDHHWTAHGAYAAYLALLQDLEIEPKELTAYQGGTIGGFYGTLYSRAPLFGVQGEEVAYYIDPEVSVAMSLGDDPVRDSLLVWENAVKKDKYTLFLGGVQPKVRIRTSTVNGKRLLILKDSFAHTLVPFLVAHFEEIHLLDLRYFRTSVQDYFIENEITDVLFVYNLSWFASDIHFETLRSE